MESYNSRVLNYPTGQHVTVYSKTINKGNKKEELNKAYVNSERTKEAEEHSINVSVKHTKNQIYKIARANTWQWFITLTFDRKQTDSSEYEIIVKRLSVFLNNLQKRKCPNLKYLIVPELHKDGKHYHFHGVLSNCDGLQFAYSGKDDNKGKPIFNVVNWKWGFTTATRVDSTERVSSYITKYITKDCAILLKNKKRYYCSHNIDLPDEEFFNIDEQDFRQTYMDRITFVKSLDVPQAYQHVTYYELDY